MTRYIESNFGGMSSGDEQDNSAAIHRQLMDEDALRELLKEYQVDPAVLEPYQVQLRRETGIRTDLGVEKIGGDPRVYRSETR